jgi:hypothetical protein
VARLERRVVELEEQLETLRGGRSPQVSSGSPGVAEEPDIDRLAADLEALRGDFVEFESQVIDFFARHGLDYRELMGPRAEQRLTRKTRPSSGHPTGS